MKRLEKLEKVKILQNGQEVDAYINIDDKLIFSVLFIVIGLALIIRKKK